MNFAHLYSFFSDPILRAPTIGSMLMCLTAGLVGALVYLRKQSLIGEALSHATYPGVVFGVLCTGFFFANEGVGLWLAVFILMGASFSALIGIWLINKLEHAFKVTSDAALCFVLSSFFGIGITLASQVQFSYTTLYKQVQVYLYGQAATMTDVHVFIYSLLALVVIATVYSLYKELQVITFDRMFAKSIGIKTRPINTLIFMLVVLAVIIGIRSVGVVLMSAMLIAPPVAARQYTNRLSTLFLLSAFFGLLSGFLGNVLSVDLSYYLQKIYPNTRITLPTGPTIVIVASIICIFSLLLAPQRGLILRLLRIAYFKYRCIGENLLKDLWRKGENQVSSFEEIGANQAISRLYLRFVLYRLVANGWVEKKFKNNYRLTDLGYQRASKIVRLHRLWEVYLVDYLGVGAERVHRNAEEMEHIITPELEKELILLLNDPKKDPHHQPIPGNI